MRGTVEPNSKDARALGLLGHHSQHLGEAEGANKNRDQREPAGKVRAAEAEARIGVEPLLPDAGNEQPQKSCKPTLERICRD